MDDELDNVLRDHAEHWRDVQPDVHASIPAGGGERATAVDTGGPRRAMVALAAVICVVLLVVGVALMIRDGDAPRSTQVATTPTAPVTTHLIGPATLTLPAGVQLDNGASVVVNFPDNTGTPTLAVDPSTPGVWAWGVTGGPTRAGAIAGDSRIWHFDPTIGATKSWSIGASGDVMGGVSFPALAACPSGVWFGSNHLLLHLDPRTGAQQRSNVPSVSSAATDAGRPDYLRGLSGVSALACDRSDGTLLIGLSDSTTAFRFHPSTGTFDPIELPADGEVTMLAASADGDVAIGLQSVTGAGPKRVLVVPHDGSPSRIVPVEDSAIVVADGNRFVVGSSAQIIEPGATTASGPLIPDSVVGRLDPLTTVPWPLTGGRFMIAGYNPGPGVVVVDPSGGAGKVSTITVTIGKEPCGRAPVIDHFGPYDPADGGLDPNITTTTLASDARCPIELDLSVGSTPGGVMVDRSGDLYGIVNLTGSDQSRQTSLVRVHLP